MIQITNSPKLIDREEYKDLCLMSILTDPQALFNSPEKYKEYTQENREKLVRQFVGKCIYGAIEHNKLIGTITAKIKNNNGFLSILYVDPLYRGLGIASNLMNHAILYLKDNGCHEVYLRVHKNQKYAICLYKKKGFIELEKTIGERIYSQSSKAKKKDKKYFIKYL